MEDRECLKHRVNAVAKLIWEAQTLDDDGNQLVRTENVRSKKLMGVPTSYRHRVLTATTLCVCKRYPKCSMETSSITEVSRA